jgi:molybdopterin-binding protein
MVGVAVGATLVTVGVDVGSGISVGVGVTVGAPSEIGMEVGEHATSAINASKRTSLHILVSFSTIDIIGNNPRLLCDTD